MLSSILVARRDFVFAGVIVVALVVAMAVARHRRVRDEPDYADLLRRGTAAWNDGRYPEAERLFAICRRGSPDAAARDAAAECLELSGELLTLLGRLPEASEEFGRARALVDGQPHSRFVLGRVLGGMAHLACTSGRYSECEGFAHDAVSQLAGAPQSKRAHALFQLGYAQRSLGKLDQARQSLRECLASYREDADAKNVATTEIELASVERQLDHLEEARSLLQDAFAWLSKQQGSGHPLAGVALSGLGNVEWRQGRRDEAEASLRGAIERIERDMGPRSPYLSSALIDLGGVLEERGATREAEEVLRRSISIREAAGDRRGAGVGAFALARLLWEQGRSSEAIAFANLSVQSLDRDRLDDLATAFYMRGLVQERLSAWAEAEHNFREAVALRESRVPVDVPALKRARAALARVTAARPARSGGGE